MVHEVEAEVEDPVEAAWQAAQEVRTTMDALLVWAAALAKVPGQEPATLRRLALRDWSVLLADLSLVRSWAFECMVRAAYVAEDPAVRSYARTVLVQKGVASPRDFDRRSCAEALAALPARLAAMGIAAPGLVG